MIEVNNLTKEKIDEKFLKKVAIMVLRSERKISKYPNINLSIALVGQKEIKKLNKQYRGKNKATDVLSFRYDNNFGEVVICPEKTTPTPKGRGSDRSVGEVLARVLVHGILHILGFTHKKMNEDKYLN
ncbi:MAG: rRNA maturation RNase YbeY [Patescibacteria group bacterium]